jgi:hypothetical protein
MEQQNVIKYTPEYAFGLLKAISRESFRLIQTGLTKFYWDQRYHQCYYHVPWP